MPARTGAMACSASRTSVCFGSPFRTNTVSQSGHTDVRPRTGYGIQLPQHRISGFAFALLIVSSPDLAVSYSIHDTCSAGLASVFRAGPQPPSAADFLVQVPLLAGQ